MGHDIGRGPFVSFALFLLRHDLRLRALFSTLIPIASFVAGRVSVKLPDWANLVLLAGAVLAIPVVYLYSLPAQGLVAVVARVLLRRGGEGLAVIARSSNDNDLIEYLYRHYPRWVAPGVAQALKERALSQAGARRLSTPT